MSHSGVVPLCHCVLFVLSNCFHWQFQQDKGRHADSDSVLNILHHAHDVAMATYAIGCPYYVIIVVLLSADICGFSNYIVFLEVMVEVKSSGPPHTCLKTVARASKGMIRVKYCRSNEASLYQWNFMEMI